MAPRQGNYAQGLRTRIRRFRRIYDETEPSDLVEYHVVRDGVDEAALTDALRQSFASVEIFSYWSSQAPFWQWAGDRTRMKTTFGLEAQHRVQIMDTRLNH